MQFPDFESKDKDEALIDVPKLVRRIKANWLYCILCAILTVSAAFLYLYVTNPTYEVMARILIQDNDKNMGGAQGSGLASMQDLGLLSGPNNVNNELGIVKSYSLIREVVSDLQLYLHFAVRDKLKNISLYKERLPFRVHIRHFHTDHLSGEQLKFEITLKGKDGFRIRSSDHIWDGKWNDSLDLPFGKVVLYADSLTGFWDIHRKIDMSVKSVDATADAFQKGIDVEIPDKQANILELSLRTSMPDQGKDVLDKLIEVYQKANVEDNNRIADSTMQFIDERLVSVSDELNTVEGNIQEFKQKNDLADLSAQAQALIANAGVNAQDIAARKVQLSVINDLLDYMNAHKDNPRIVPASLMVDDASISSAIDKYNTLLLQRERLLLSSTQGNPIVQNIDEQLGNLRDDMVSGLKSLQRSFQAALAEMGRNSGALDNMIRQVPAKERTFLEFSRQQSIKQELYLFLLQKREECAISKSSTVSNARVIDYGRVLTPPVAPNKRNILGLSFLVGIILPFLVSIFRNILNTRIRSMEDLEKATQVPVLAEIIHNADTDGEGILVTKSSRNLLTEQFRILRTDLNFLLPDTKKKVILVTSSMPGEGKTFVSLNLGAMMALSGKKVIILELDLRKPKLSQRLGLKGERGFTHYAIGQADLQEVIYPVNDYSHLFILPSGPVPPNPAELILLDKTAQMFSELRNQFDYIIIDTTPNMVADSRLISAHADVTLYLVRMGYTYKEQINSINRLYSENKMPRLNLVINDVRIERGGYYGYGYGYLEEEGSINKQKWRRFKRRA